MTTPPPGFRTLRELHMLKNNSMVNVIARVLANPPGLISLTDLTICDRSETDFDVVANFDRNPGEWHPTETPQVGDVVVLTNFNKKTGYQKGNPVLYSKKHVSKVVFYNQNLKSYNKYPAHEPPAEYISSHPVYKYISILIDDWKQDPRSGWDGDAAAVMSFPMSLEEVSKKFDTSRLTTIKGKISELDTDVFQLTDAPGWKVQLGAYKFEDEMRQRCREKYSCHVELSHVRFKSYDKSSRKLFAKMTDRTSIDPVEGKELESLKARLSGKSKKADTDAPSEDNEVNIVPSKKVQRSDDDSESEQVEDSPETPAYSTPESFELQSETNLDSQHSETEEMGDDAINDLVNAVCGSPESSAKPDSPFSHDKSETGQNKPPPSGQPRMTSPTPLRPEPDLLSHLSQGTLTNRDIRSRDVSPRAREDDSEQPVIPHEIPVRKKLKSESPMSRTPFSRPQVSQPPPVSPVSQGPSVSPVSQGPSVSPVSQGPPAQEFPTASQSGPMLVMSEYIVPDIEEPYLVVSGVVRGARVTDKGFLSFAVYCECVNKLFTVKIRKEDEGEFLLGVSKRNQEMKLKALVSWAAQQEHVKVNLIQDEHKNENGESEYWSVGNSLEWQM
ncbi:YALIA101S10e01728g1_1 [Yarrowia lipolytica]|nr:YALIA101S10e01728g1_1 [Yarrowia lipolytica]